MKSKKCGFCRKTLKITEFYKHDKQGYQCYCKKCCRKQSVIWGRNNLEKLRLYDKKRYKKQREKRLKYQNEYYHKTKEKYKKRRRLYNKKNKPRRIELTLKRKYGLNTKTLRKMKKEQNYKCYICKIQCKLVIDHCHKTGKVRKLLCNPCNLGLGTFKDNIRILKSATLYLENFNERS